MPEDLNKIKQERKVISADINQYRAIMSELPDAVLIDVREPDEFVSGHLPGAENVPLGRIASWAAFADPAKPVLLHCLAGGRAARARDFLAVNGFLTVIDLCGINDYKGDLA